MDGGKQQSQINNWRDALKYGRFNPSTKAIENWSHIFACDKMHMQQLALTLTSKRKDFYK
jgi:sarcosine oxidase delta subunit